MKIITLLFPQIFLMFALMALGYFCYRKNKLSEQSSKELSWLLVNIVIPVVLFNSFLREYSATEFNSFLIAVIYSVIAIVIGIAVSYIFFRKNQALERFASIYSNASFIGIPIISAIFSKEVLFYLSAYIVVFMLFIFTHGLYLISKDINEISLKKIIKNPTLIAILLGIIIYSCNIQFPTVISNFTTVLGSLNTPLSMILLGCFMAKGSLGEMLKNYKALGISFVRLIIVPITTIIFFSFIEGDYLLKMIVVVTNAVPSAIMLALFAEIYDENPKLAAQYVSITTLLSIISLPIIIFIAEKLL
ncbi:MAG: AEC family transporter [Anaerorhabdus sp.]